MPAPIKPQHEIGPRERAVRTIAQVFTAVALAIPSALAALSGAGVEIAGETVALLIGIGGAFTVLVSAAQNAWDSRS